MRRASIKCPHCDQDIIVQDSDGSKVDREKGEKIFEEVEVLFSDVRKGFKRIFHPDLWK